MRTQRRKCSQEFKMEMVEAVLSGESPLVVGRENNLNPNLIHRGERMYLEGKYHGNSKSDSELRKPKIDLSPKN